MHRIIILSAVFAGLIGIGAGHATTIDSLSFGDAASEAAHDLHSAASEIVARGGLGQPARRLMPHVPQDVYGGEMAFTMRVDPLAQNYFTVKLWGSETPESSRQLLVLHVNGLELGERHGGSAGAPDIFVNTSMSWHRDRFVYRTVALPLHLTRGRTAVSLKIRSMGWLSFYDTRGYYDAYQKLMNAPSIGIYKAATHTDPLPDVAGEPQGNPPKLTTPRTAEAMPAALESVKRNVNQMLAGKLLAPATALSAGDIQFLARCHDARESLGQSWITYPAPKTAADLVDQVVAGIDAQISAQSADAGHVGKFGNDSWGGYFGPLGEAIRLLWPQMKGAMGATVAFGGRYGEVTRTAGWAKGLRESVDYGRYHRRSIANQALYSGDNTYMANRGLQLVDPASAIAEPEAVRYLKEACGVMPWLHDDLPSGGTDGAGGGPVPTRGTAPLGPDWYQCTSKSTSKDELGFVGSDYGEIGPWVYRLGMIADDESIRNKGLALTRARCLFRFPCDDGDGCLTMQGPDAIGDRNSDMPGRYAYLGRIASDYLLLAAQGPAVIGKDLVGYAQQQARDGQLARFVAGIRDPYLPRNYEAFAALPPTGEVLPMTAGAADFAWVDEENMVVAAKRGEERLFANLYWRQPRHVMGFAKVLHILDDRAHLADVVLDDLRLRPTGSWVTIGPLVEGGKYQPADNPINAFVGVSRPVALRSDLAAPPPDNRDAGRANGVTLRYGNWLIGINPHHADGYAMQLPTGFSSAKDLVSGTDMKRPVVLPPKSSAVFYLDASAGSMPRPSRPLYVGGFPGIGQVTLCWQHAAAAVRYDLRRAAGEASGFTTIAEGLTDTQFTDTSVTSGTTYRYVVTAIAADGAKNDSFETTATPSAGERLSPESPWSHSDIGPVQTPGGVKIEKGRFMVAGRGGDLWETVDGCHFLHQPMVGDGILTAQVRGQTSTVEFAKAGLMIRESLEPGARRALTVIEPGKRGEFNFRYGPDMKARAAPHVTKPAITAPYWVRLIRRGDEFTGLVSPDGKRWTPVGQARIVMGRAVYAGLVSSASNGPDLNVATFTNVTMPAGAESPPQPPTGVTATPGHGSARLEWQAAPNAYRYRVKRGTSADGPFSVVAELEGTSSTDYGLEHGTTYHYVVTSVSPPHESGDSTSVAVTPVAPPPAPAHADVACVSGTATLSWTAVPEATSYVIARSESRQARDSFKILADDLREPRYVDSAVKDGTAYYYAVTARNGVAAGPPLFMEATPPGLASRWRSQDIGTVAAWGKATSSSGTCTLTGSGSDIWRTADEFRYVYLSAESRCSMTARVASCTTENANPKAGIMIRDTLDPGSRFVHLFLRAKGGIGFEQRKEANGECTSIGTASGQTAPVWLRLTRVGPKVVAEHSPDGSRWSPVGAATVGLRRTTLLGLTVCSTSNGAVETATFDGVRLKGTVTRPPTGGDADGDDGETSATGSPEP